jgi:Tfp pilus assembly protein PilE
MKKNWFTLMEVMLSIILFSLMVWAILWAYTSIQRANLKTANTQEAIQVAEDFLERINDMSMEYSIDTTKYSSWEYEPISYWQIINTGALHLKNESGDTTSFYSNNGIKTGLYMKNPSWTEINLINNDKVSISKLNFEIYPREQYVNANITATVQWWESLFKSGVTLSTTIWFKYYTFYAWEITPETLCEDICSVAKMQSSAMSNAWNWWW